jgi:hypothetical protein
MFRGFFNIVKRKYIQLVVKLGLCAFVMKADLLCWLPGISLKSRLKTPQGFHGDLGRERA